MTDSTANAAKPPAPVFSAASNVSAIILMVWSRALFACSDVFTKYMGEHHIPATELTAIRNTLASVVLLILAWRTDALRLLMPALRHPIVLGRAALESVGVLLVVAALPHVSLGESAVILQTVPLLLVPLSAIFMREQVGWRRWTAIIMGFVGVLMVAGPLEGRINVWLLATETGAIFYATRDLITQRIGRSIPTILVTLITTQMTGLFGILGSPTEHWVAIDWKMLAAMTGAALFLSFANNYYIRAMREGAIAVVAPFRYSAVLWAVILGLIFWGDFPDLMATCGTLLIIGSGLYTFQRELRSLRLGRISTAEAPAENVEP